MTNSMTSIIKFEELGQLALAVLLFSQLDYAWWVFPACLLLPDLSMIGYLANPRIGALLYNIFHHKLLAIACIAIGYWLDEPLASLAGVILLGHSAMDRALGYGLKYSDSFKNTHMGRIGKTHKADMQI